MAQIYANYNNYVGLNTQKTIHSKAGKIRNIIVNGNSAAAQIIFYDNPSNTGNILLILYVNTFSIIQLNFDLLTPLVFNTGLCIVTGAQGSCFVITEA